MILKELRLSRHISQEQLAQITVFFWSFGLR